MHPTKLRAAVVALTLAATLSTPTLALAKDGATLREGDCRGAGPASWKIQVSQQDRRVAVEYEIDVNRRGQRWRVTLFQNNRRIMRAVRTTRGLSGSLEVRAVRPDRRGADHFRARAVRLGDRQVCRGQARFRG
jgi:hypothetical protein